MYSVILEFQVRMLLCLLEDQSPETNFSLVFGDGLI